MSFLELGILAFALSMDAFAVAICLGLGMQKATFKRALIIGLYFGIFQALMPLIGYFVASLFAEKIQKFDHWIAFALLLFLGLKMIFGCFKKEKEENKEISLTPPKMIPYAIATSIDALAVGVSLAFLDVGIWPAVLLIGVVTFALSMVAVKLGSFFGLKFKTKAEFIGGIVLVLIGIKILLEHCGVF